jgi:hypothetical protein
MTYPYEEFGDPVANARDSYREENERLRATLRAIENMPATMANDSESLRHTIKTIRYMARAAITSGQQSTVSQQKE